MKLWPLESLRGFVALYVVLHHARLFDRGGWGSIFYFGQEAVILFFILSGFVIEYSCAKKKISPKSYIIKRFFRIYPIFIFSLILAYFSKIISGNNFPAIDWKTLTGNLLMLQDVSALKPGVWFDTFSGNSPLWSLSYEWWFYVSYMLIVLIWKRSANQGTIIVSIISILGAIGFYLQPAQPFLFMNYLVIWWAGVIMAKEFCESNSLTINGQSKTLALIFLMIIFWWVVAMIKGTRGLGEYPLLQVRHFSSSLAAIFCAIIFFKIRIPLPIVFMRPFIWFGSISYAIYVIHQPILDLSSAMVAFENIYCKFFFAMALIIFVAWILELKIQPALSLWVKKIF